jgi:EpsI family protein
MELRMDAERKLLVVLAVALVLTGAVSWRAYLRPTLGVDPASLGSIPHRIGPWSGADHPVDGGVVQMLAADYNLQRTYAHPVGDIVWLYVGYYGTERGGRPEHTPWVCYPTNGWKIVQRDVVNTPGVTDGKANELIIERNGERRLVHFWYQSYRRTGMTGGLDQAVDRLLGRLLEGRADGSLVRISTPVDDQSAESAARSRLFAFSREVGPLLREHWPAEHSDTEHTDANTQTLNTQTLNTQTLNTQTRPAEYPPNDPVPARGSTS